jgi:hypothetical protein
MWTRAKSKTSTARTPVRAPWKQRFQSFDQTVPVKVAGVWRKSQPYLLFRGFFKISTRFFFNESAP